MIFSTHITYSTSTPSVKFFLGFLSQVDSGAVCEKIATVAIPSLIGRRSCLPHCCFHSDQLRVSDCYCEHFTAQISIVGTGQVYRVYRSHSLETVAFKYSVLASSLAFRLRASLPYSFYISCSTATLENLTPSRQQSLFLLRTSKTKGENRYAVSTFAI